MTNLGNTFLNCPFLIKKQTFIEVAEDERMNGVGTMGIIFQ